MKKLRDDTGVTPSGRVYAQKTSDERRDERRQRLLDAGLDLFAAQGFSETTVQQLCSEARVSARTFYEEFQGREELLIELHDLLNARAFDAVIGAVTPLPDADLTARATEGVRAYFQVMTSDSRWARIALVESVGVNSAVDDHRRAAIARFADLIAAQLALIAAEGVIERRDFSLTAIGLVGALNELVMTWSSRPDWDDIADDVIAEGAHFIISAAQPHSVASAR